jgi:hypothetical protein
MSYGITSSLFCWSGVIFLHLLAQTDVCIGYALTESLSCDR